MRSRTLRVHIITNTSRAVLCVGVIGNPLHRILRHRADQGSAFSRRYRVRRLAHVEQFEEARPAIEREKAIEFWLRRRKKRVIGERNAGWEDLGEGVLGLEPFTPGAP